jgi:hypothetical protein
VSDIDTAAVDSLKTLDPKRPIREADMCGPRLSQRKRVVLPSVKRDLFCIKHQRSYLCSSGLLSDQEKRYMTLIRGLLQNLLPTAQFAN